MDSSNQPNLPAIVAVQEPGSRPLSNPEYERYAVLRAAMCGRLEAARDAGISLNAKRPTNLTKIERKKAVKDRIAYLARDTVEVVRTVRAKVTQKLNIIADVSMADFIRMERDPSAVRYLREQNSPKTIEALRKRMEAEKKTPEEIEAAVAALPTDAEVKAAIASLPVLPWLDLAHIAKLAPDQQREILSAAKSVKLTESGPQLELHSPLDAIAQLRKMNGMDEAEKHDLSGALTLEALIGASYAKPKQVEQQNDEPSQQAAE